MRWLDEFPLSANVRWLFTEYADADRVAHAAEAGFGGVEIAVPYTYPAAELAARVRDANLHVVLINTPAGEPGSPTQWGLACLPDNTDTFRQAFELALSYAVELRADHIHVMGGQRPPGLDQGRAYATYLDNVAWASRHAASSGVGLLLEVINQVDVPGFVLGSTADAVAAVETVGSPNVRLMFDVYHCQMNGEDVALRLRQALPMVAHVQVADAPGRNEPGTGSVPWPAVLDELRAARYEGWVGCEYTPREGTVTSLAWAGTVGRVR